MSKQINIGGRIHSTEVGNVSVGANEVLDDTKGKKQNVINADVDAELLRLDQSKQDNLTFDNTPTEGSNNPVKSGGVYAADKALSDAIEAILLLIPSAATALNQLADKAFVNSSVSTATATFRGTYNVVTDLELAYDATHEQIATKLGQVIATADNNDYAFVQVPVSATSTDIRRTERYKFNGTVWGYEYDLNTSGFTAVQWEAINSGITALLVSKLTNLPTAEVLATMFNAKQNVLTFDAAPTALSTNPVYSGGVYAAIKAITDLIPAEATTTNQLADKAYVLASILAATPAFKGQFTSLVDLQAVSSPKAGDLGIVRTKDNDGKDVFTFYQYLNNQWNVYFSLSYHPQTKPATTGTTGYYPYNGMGRVELPMNIVEGVNTLTQSMMPTATGGNTVYVIKYDFTLGEDITVPANCVLKFDGGSISNTSGNTFKLIGNPRLINPVLHNVENTLNSNIQDIFSCYGCYTETIEGDINQALDIKSLGFGYVIYYCFEIARGKSEEALENMRLFDLCGLNVIAYVGGTVETVGSYANILKDCKNLIGWLVDDEIESGTYTSEDFVQICSILKSVRNVPCYAASQSDYYYHSYNANILNALDYVLVDHYYNMRPSSDKIIGNDEDIINTYGQLTGLTPYKDKIIPVYACNKPLSDADYNKYINNAFIKKSLFGNYGVFHIYRATFTVPSGDENFIYKNLNLRKAVRCIINDCRSTVPKMVLKGFTFDKPFNNDIGDVSDLIASSEGLYCFQDAPYYSNYGRGIYITNNNPYMVIDLGLKVTSIRLAYRGIVASLTDHIKFDIGIPVSDYIYKKIHTCDLLPNSGGFNDEVVNIYGINSSKIVIAFKMDGYYLNLFSCFSIVGIQGFISDTIEQSVVYDNYKFNNKGESNERPVLLSSRYAGSPSTKKYESDYVGFEYFDNTLGRPIYWNGTAWVDATGTPV